ncbi:STAS domain-containing protein [bacterium]|nr:STAS domain-containing protein [bacterium]RQV93761.1 MAG: anti-sigma factor antagonist [bacterium]
MACKVKIIDQVAIIKIRGVLSGDEETREIHDQLKALVSEGIHRFVLDMSRVKWMNSHGLGMLMACYKAVQDVNGRIGMAKTPDRVMKIMNVSKINTLFDHFDSLKQAVRHLR